MRWSAVVRGSKAWQRRQASDPFVRGRQDWVSRSAFKLVELHERKRVLPDHGVILDLGCAPGGWIQAARSLTSAHIIGVDLLPLDPVVVDQVERVDFVRGDMLDAAVRKRLRETIDGRPVTLVLSDMLHDMSGNPLRDNAMSVELCDMAFTTALDVGLLAQAQEATDRPVLVMKCLQSQDAEEFKRQVLGRTFGSVSWFKPKSSRPESKEAYLVCAKPKPP